MRVRPENLAQLWRATKEEILNHHPELVGIRAGDLAAAHLLNWFHEDWAALREDVKNAFLAGRLHKSDEQLQTFGNLIDWTPLRELQQLSGSRTIMQDLNHPIVTERSIPPANILAVENHWKTERIEDVDSIEDVQQVWKDIRAEFRGRADGREGSILTNQQGALAIRTAFEILDLQHYGEFSGITCHLIDAEATAEFFRHEADVWPADPGKNFKMLAGVFEEAISDALAHGKRAVAIVDTTSEGYEGPSLTLSKQIRRHEAFHVWETTIKPDDQELLEESVIVADTAYAVPETALDDYYTGISPNQIVSEAIAFISSGDWENAGFVEKAPALEYLDRYFTTVVHEYGIEALNDLRLVHPDTKEVIEHVRARTENDIERASKSVAERAREDGQTESQAPPGRGKLRTSQSGLAGRGIGEDDGGLRRDRQDAGGIRSPSRSVASVEITKQPAHFLSASADVTQSTAELLAALQTISQIDSIDPSGTLSWKELVFRSAGIANEAIAKVKEAGPAQDRNLVTALVKIAGIGAAIGDKDQNERQLSWKDLVGITIDTARQTLEKTEPLVPTISQVSNTREQANPRHDHGMEW